jgi:hypothetical protein
MYFNQNSLPEVSLPSSSQAAAAFRSSGFFCSYPRIALVALSRIDNVIRLKGCFCLKGYFW